MDELNKQTICVVIPSLQPDDNFVTYVRSIKGAGADYIIIIDDGSPTDYNVKFEELKKDGAIVLRHATNCGKGRAIKTALNFIAVEMPCIDTIVICDGDGTFLANDVIKVANYALDNTITLGCRDFDSDNITKNMRDTNQITAAMLHFLGDITMSDTTTNLRAFKRDILSYLITVPGERYDYDFNMIFEKKDIALLEVSVTTTNLQNKRTHLVPIKDMMAIILTFLGFIVVSLSSTILDLLLYSFFINMFESTFPLMYISYATFLARVISDAYNYYFDRTFVFKTKETSSFGRYIILCIGKTMFSALAVTILVLILDGGEMGVKLFVDTLIFFMAYKIEKNWVHSKK